MILEFCFCILHLLDVVAVDAVLQQGDQCALSDARAFVDFVEVLVVVDQLSIDLAYMRGKQR